MVSAASSRHAPTDPPLVVMRLAAGAALIGGTAWTLKAGVVLVTNDEPPVAFALGLVLFPFALLGLWSLLGGAGKRAGQAGGVLAGVAAVCGVLALVVRAVGGEAVEPSEDEVTLLTPFIAGAGIGTVLALIALGVAVRRTRSLAPGFASLPLVMGLAVFPLLAVGGALESVSERLLEVPIVLLGLGWVGLGIALWNVKMARSLIPMTVDLSHDSSSASTWPGSRRFGNPDSRDP